MNEISGGEYDPAHTTPGAEHAAPTVLCPQGHANAWNYKFCGECGAPIGVAAWPADEPDPVPEHRSRSRVPLIAGLATLVVIAVVISVAVFLMGLAADDGQRSGPGFTNPQAGTAPTSAGPALCQDAPMMEVESFDLTSDGLEVQAAFVSPCGADVESNSALVVTAAEGRRDVAAAVFDFSTHPLVIDRGVPARRTLVFPPGMYWRTPDMLSEAPRFGRHARRHVG